MDESPKDGPENEKLNEDVTMLETQEEKSQNQKNELDAGVSMQPRLES